MIKSIVTATFFIFFCNYCVLQANGQLPSYITACSRSDPNLNECVLKVSRASAKKFSKGDTSRGFPRLDPMKIKEIRTAAFGNRDTGINILFKDVSVKGLKNLDFHKFVIDLKKNTYLTEVTVNLTLESKYELKGRILIFPLVGNGNAKVDIQNVKFKYLLQQGFENKNGTKYPTVVETKLDYKIQGAKIKLDNLFNGDKVLGQTTNNLLNENWKELVDEIGGPIVAAIKKQVDNFSEIFFSQVSYDQMFAK